MRQNIFCYRDEDGFHVEGVKQAVVHHSPRGFAWGYAGSGPADLALNILEAQLRYMGHQGPRVDCWRGSCFRFAWNWHQQFKWEFIATLPEQGGTITWTEVAAWIIVVMEE